MFPMFFHSHRLGMHVLELIHMWSQGGRRGQSRGLDLRKEPPNPWVSATNRNPVNIPLVWQGGISRRELRPGSTVARQGKGYDDMTPMTTTNTEADVLNSLISDCTLVIPRRSGPRRDRRSIRGCLLVVQRRIFRQIGRAHV